MDDNEFAAFVDEHKDSLINYLTHLTRSRERAEAETMLRELQRGSKDGHASPYLIATIYAGLGNKDTALEFLEKARQERSWDISWQIKADLRLDNLRSDPRFQALLRRVGLSQ